MSFLNPTFSIRELAEQAKRDGSIDLTQGIINAPPPQVLLDNVRKLPLEKYSTYNNKRGVPEYREAIQLYLTRRKWAMPLEQILATSGAMGGITSALLTDCRPGDTVLLPEPFFVYHKLLLEKLGFNIQYFPVPLDKQPDWEQLKERMKEAKALILTTPANPTGQVAPFAVLQNLSEAATKHDCLLIVDEMYREFIWDGPPENDENYMHLNLKKTVLLRSFSKTFAIPGWRIGFAVTSPERVEAMATTHDTMYIGGSTIAQHALAASITSNLDPLNKYVENLRVQLQKNRELLTEAFQSYGMLPLPVPATYYMLLKHNRASDSDALKEFIQQKIVVTPANILFADSSQDTGYIRIHFAITPKSAEEVAEILAR